MDKKKMIQNKTIDILFLGIMLISIFFIFDPAFADLQVSSNQNNPQILFQYSNQTQTIQNTVTVYTDRYSYADGDFIAISGYVTPVKDYKFVAMEIFNPDGILIHVNQISLGGGGSYYTSFIIGGVKWTEIGAYTVKVHYGPNKMPFGETIFTFDGKSSKQPTSGELTLNDNRLMRSTGITALYKTVYSLDPDGDFLHGYSKNKKIMLSEIQNVNQTVLDGEYYGTYVGLSNIAQEANESLTKEGKEKILPLVNGLITSVQIYTTPEFPTFVPLVLGILIVIGLLRFTNKLYSH